MDDLILYLSFALVLLGSGGLIAFELSRRTAPGTLPEPVRVRVSRRSEIPPPTPSPLPAVLTWLEPILPLSCLPIILGRDIKQQWVYWVWTVLQAFVFVTLLAFLATYRWRRRQAGALLLDLSSRANKRKWIRPAIFFSVLFVLFLAATAVALIRIGTELHLGMLASLLSLILINFFNGAISLLFALSRTEIREKGFWINGGLFPWHKVDSYRCKQDCLAIRQKGCKNPWYLSIADQVAVEQLLGQYVRVNPTV